MSSSERSVTSEALEEHLLSYLRDHVAASHGPKSAADALVLLVHAVMSRSGFKLVGLGEQGNLVGT